MKSEKKEQNIQAFRKYHFQNEQIIHIFNSQFTNREIDIISCALHGKSAKIIGMYLGISQRTVEVHMNNIMKKFEFHSKQQVLQYIETKKCLHLFQTHYLSLIEKYNFEQKLRALQLVLSKNNLNARLYVGYNDDLGKSIEDDLIFIGISVQIIFESNRTHPFLIFINEGEEFTNEVNRSYFIEAYQTSFMNLFLHFVSKIEIENINNKYKIEYEERKDIILFQFKSLKFISKKYFIISSVFLILLISFYYSYFYKDYQYFSNIYYSIHSKDEIIERKFLYQRISDVFDNGRFVVLTGIGGAGKTTLGKIYAQAQKNKFSYVVNCESRANFYNSFREIGFILSRTKAEIEEFSQILNIVHEKEREIKVTEYIQKKLKNIKSWILIFDNVKNYSDFSDIFQCNPKYWKNGKIIFTSQNANIECDFITSYLEVVEVPPLTEDERSDLFNKIIFSHEKRPESIDSRLPIILNNVAPFPLDISLVAYHIKNSRSEIFDDALIKEITEHIQGSKHGKEKSLLQKRHLIMWYGLEKVTESNDRYKSMLYLCSFLNTMNVPCEFMSLLYNRSDITSFIKKMNEYSFIEYEKLRRDGLNKFIHFHNTVIKNIQEFTKHVLDKRDQISIQSGFIDALYLYITSKIHEKDRDTIIRLIPNLEDLISNKKLQESYLLKVRFLLALCYKLNYCYEKSKILFNDNIRTLASVVHKDVDFYSRNLAYLGMIYRNLGDFESARKHFDQFINIHKSKGISNHFTFKIELEKAKLYRNIGLYKEALYSSEKSLIGFKEDFSTDYINIISALNSSGAIYRIIGEYQRSLQYLNEALNLSKSKFNHTKSIYPSTLIQLGSLHWILGDYDKAQCLLTESVHLLKTKFQTSQRDLAYALTSMGKNYIKLSNYKQAEQCFLESQQIFEKNFSVNYRENVWNLVNLAIIKIKINQLGEAKELLLKAEGIFEKGFPKNYIDRAWQISYLAFVEACFNNRQQVMHHLQRAEEIFAHGFSKKHYFYAWYLMKKAEILSKIDKLEEATSCASESFELCKQIFGKESLKTKEYFSKSQKIYKTFYNDIKK